MKIDNFLIRNLSNTTKKLGSTLQRLASGKRINKASDDAAGLAIADALARDAAVLEQGNRNIQDGVSFSQIAEGAMEQIQNNNTRIAELATQAANGTLTDEQRASLNQEAQALKQENERILQTTQFNGTNVFSGASIDTGNG
ncbi:MAG: flagellin FliC, partial [Candidatus Dadabacteria bacterium]